MATARCDAMRLAWGEFSTRRLDADESPAHDRPTPGWFLGVSFRLLAPYGRPSAARIVNVSSGVGSLAENANPAHPYHPMLGPIYPASKTAPDRDVYALGKRDDTMVRERDEQAVAVRGWTESGAGCVVGVR
jgi:hypothetical protein